MWAKIKTAVAIALLTGFAFAAQAATPPFKPKQIVPSCTTDEGQGRIRPCDAGGP